ncbi:uncharacterized protein LOC144445622 isoform X2 [Glandiceps talaboti]
MKEKHKKKRSRTWAEAAKIVLEMTPNTPMSYKEILQVIQKEGLKDISGTTPIACINSMLHTHARGSDGIFYKVAGKTGVYGLKSHLPENIFALLEMQQDDEDGSVDAAEDDIEDVVNTSKDRQVKEKKKALCVLPEHAHYLIPTLKNRLEDGDHITMAAAYNNHEGDTGQQQDHVKYSSSQSTTSKVHQQHPNRFSERQAQMEIRAEEKNAVNCNNTGGQNKKQTPSEIMAAIPGLSRKPRRRFNKKLSHSSQIARTKVGCVDLETPDSILVNTNLKALINKHTFSSLPAACQHKLLQLLPAVDKVMSPDGATRMSGTALSNEFFARACIEWKDRLADGEFTPENKMKIKQEAEREQAKLDPWKVKHFEPIWGQSILPDPISFEQYNTSIVTRNISSLSASTLKISRPSIHHMSTKSSSDTNSRRSSNSTSKSTKSGKRNELDNWNVSATSLLASSSSITNERTKPRILQSPRLVRMLNEPSELGRPEDVVQQARTALKRPKSLFNFEHPPAKKVKVTIVHREEPAKEIQQQQENQSVQPERAPSVPTQVYAQQKEQIHGAQACVQSEQVNDNKQMQQTQVMTDACAKTQMPMKMQTQPLQQHGYVGELSPTKSLPTSSPPQRSLKTTAQVRVQTTGKAQAVHGQTRTLAQIKVQTAAKAHASQGTTRTLAQIKAQTKARQAARTQAQTRARPMSASVAVTNDTKSQMRVQGTGLVEIKPKPHQWMNLKSIVPVPSLESVSSATGQVGMDASNALVAVAGQSIPTSVTVVSSIGLLAPNPNQAASVMALASQPLLIAAPVVSQHSSVTNQIIRTKVDGQLPVTSRNSQMMMHTNTGATTFPCESLTYDNSSAKVSPDMDGVPLSQSAQAPKSSKLSGSRSNSEADSNKVGEITNNGAFLPNDSTAGSDTISNASEDGSGFTSEDKSCEFPRPGSLDGSTQSSTCSLIPNGSENQGTTAIVNSHMSGPHVTVVQNENRPLPVCSCESGPQNSVPLSHHNSVSSAETNGPSSMGKCSCRLKAMIMCKGCGAFCHDDCIGPSTLCVACLIK